MVDKYTCTLCAKTYARPDYLRRHQRQHVNSKPYPCTACGKSFARSDVLARHRIRCSAGCLRTSSTSAQLPKREETEEVKPAIFAPFSSIASSLSVDNEPSVSVGSLSEQVGGSLDETGLAVGSDQWGRLTGEVGLRVEAAGTRPYADQRWQDDGLPLGLDLTSTWLNEARITPPSTRPTTPFASGQRLHPSSLTWALSRSASGVDSLGPEWKMMVSNRELKDLKSGVGSYRTVRGDPYWIDLTLFRWTYGVDHWHIPPLQTLTRIAKRTMNTIIPHFPFVHKPTFGLMTVPLALGFAMAVCGSLGGREKMIGEEEREDEVRKVVRIEKTDKLIEVLPSRLLNSKVQLVGMVQALILYRAPSFLSADREERSIAHLHLGTIIQVARQVGLLDPFTEHVRNAGPVVDMSFGMEGLEREWKRWIWAEGARRTTWILFILDTSASFETLLARLIPPTELLAFPLPASDRLWSRTDPLGWAVEAFREEWTLGDALSEFFADESDGSIGLGRVVGGGWMIWLVLMSVLTREIVEFGEGKRGVGARTLPELKRALERWRVRCDCDAEASTFDRADPGSALGAAYFRREAMSFELVAHTLVGMFALAPPSNGSLLRSSGIQLSKLLTDARTLVDRSLLAVG